MSDLYQDITITINLSELTPTKYKKIIKELKKIDINVTPETYTYDCSEHGEELSEEHKKLFKKFVK